MPEENNNQPATPPINYEEHLDWFRVFVFIILPIQFIGNLSVIYEYIRDFNQYDLSYIIVVLTAAAITLVSIAIVFWASIKQKPIGYKVIWFYSIFIAIYQIYSFFSLYLYEIKKVDLNLANEIVSNYLFSDIITVIGFTLVAIINLIYFSHRKFLFGIPDEKSIPPESKEEE